MAEIALRISTNALLSAPPSDQPYRLISKFVGDASTGVFSWITYDEQALTIPFNDEELIAQIARDQWYELVVMKDDSGMSVLMIAPFSSNFDPRQYKALMDFIETDPNFFQPGDQSSIYKHLKK